MTKMARRRALVALTGKPHIYRWRDGDVRVLLPDRMWSTSAFRAGHEFYTLAK